MKTLMIIMIVVMIIAIVITIVAIKSYETQRKEKNKLAIELAKAKSDLEFEKTIKDVRSEIYKKSEKEKQNLENSDNRTKFNNAYNILHNNKS